MTSAAGCGATSGTWRGRRSCSRAWSRFGGSPRAAGGDRRHGMWIHTMPRSEYDVPFLLNLALCSRVNISQLGERWFIEVMLESEAVPVATARTQEEAMGIVRRIFDAIRAGESALDLSAQPEPRPEEQTGKQKERKRADPPKQL